MLFFIGLFLAIASIGWSAEYVEDTHCGKSFSAMDSWAADYNLAYEVINKGKKGFKVKTLAQVNGKMIHLECTRNLPTIKDALSWLTHGGYEFSARGSEKNYTRMSGEHKTASKGPLKKVPQRVIK